MLETPPPSTMASGSRMLITLANARATLPTLEGDRRSSLFELTALLGEPLETRVYDADEAADRMLEAGESLFFALSGRILQAHVDENNVLQCLILRDAIPEALY